MDALSGARPRKPNASFGSVWDAQLGATARPAASGLAPLPDDEEDLEEPEIPEYLLAERRRGAQGGGGNRGGNRSGGGGGGGGRGGARGAYNAAIERERYGGARGAPSSASSMGGSRYAEPARGSSGGGGRAPQPSRGPVGGRSDRPERVDRGPRSGGQEWSEVPPELEQMLLAQMQRSPKSAPTSAPKAARPAPKSAAPVAEAPAAEAPAEAPKRRTTTRKAAAPAEG